MRPLAGCKVYGSLWWLPSICYRQGGTAMNLNHRFIGTITTVILLSVPVIANLKSRLESRSKVSLNCWRP